MLCPEELCLGPATDRALLPNAMMAIGLTNNNISGGNDGSELSIWTNEAAEKGTRFLPWKGTVRSDKLAVFNKLPEFDVSSFKWHFCRGRFFRRLSSPAN